MDLLLRNALKEKFIPNVTKEILYPPCISSFIHTLDISGCLTLSCCTLGSVSGSHLISSQSLPPSQQLNAKTRLARRAKSTAYNGFNMAFTFVEKHSLLCHPFCAFQFDTMTLSCFKASRSNSIILSERRVEGTEDPPVKSWSEHHTARHLRVVASQLPLQFKKSIDSRRLTESHQIAKQGQVLNQCTYILCHVLTHQYRYCRACSPVSRMIALCTCYKKGPKRPSNQEVWRRLKHLCYACRSNRIKLKLQEDVLKVTQVPN